MRHCHLLVIALAILLCGCAEADRKHSASPDADYTPQFAMKRLLASYEDAKSKRDTLTQAWVADSIADLFASAFNLEQAAEFRKEAIELYSKKDLDISQLRNRFFAENRLKSMNLYSEKTSRRLSEIDSTLHDAHQNGNLFSAMLDYSDDYGFSASAAASLDWKGWERLAELERNMMIGRTRIEANVFSSIVLRLQGRMEEADSLLRDADRFAHSHEDKVMILYARYLHAKESGDTRLALNLADSLIFYQESITENIMKNSINSSYSAFYEELAEENRKKSRTYLLLSISTAIAVLIIILAFWLFYRLRSKAHRAELEANVEALIGMKAYADKVAAEKILLGREIDGIKKEYAENDERRNSILEKLFRDKWSTLNHLCEEYFVIGTSRKLRESTSAKIEEEIRKIGSDEGLLLIEEEVDRYMDGIVNKLRQQCPFLKSNDIAFCTLIFAGFSVKAICFILGLQTGYFYVKKGRLIKKINESEAQDKDLFIKSMSS